MRPYARRPITLLQLAIVASMAVVPVLLGVLLAVTLPRSGDGTNVQTADRHVSLRHVAALKTFESGIVRRDTVVVGAPSPQFMLLRVPQCAAEWGGDKGALGRLRAFVSRSADAGSGTADRLSAQLRDIDQALLRFSSGDNRRVGERVGLDGERWLAAVVSALQTPIESADYPGRRFTLQCSDIAVAVAMMARGNARMLPALAWRGTEVDRVVAQWRPEQYVEISARQLARANPWSGIPGCVYLRHGASDASPSYFVSAARSVEEPPLCAREELLGTSGSRGAGLPGEPAPDMAFDDPRWKVPPSLAFMLQPLDSLRRPTGALYRSYTVDASGGVQAAAFAPGPNRVQIGRNAIDVGYSIDTTIDPELQALAQRTAACYTGRDDICKALGITRKEDGTQPVGHALLEHAMVRMAGIAVIDVASGRIEALAGALSPCTRQEYDGPGRARGCDPRMPYPIRYRPDALQNPAVFHDAMPASTIKPIMAAAFLADPEVGARWLAQEQADIARAPAAIPSAQSLRGQLMHSDSARFLDRMFCSDKGFGPCARIWAIQAQAAGFGWNADCATPRRDCGKRDLLFGRAAGARADNAAPAFEVMYGRLLVEPSGDLTAPFHVRSPIVVDRDKLRRCAAGPDGKWPSKDDWEKCGGGVVVDLVAEGWGQGHARASALGGAGMMAMLAAAANGDRDWHAPHLIDAVRGAGAGAALPMTATVEPNRIAPAAAQVILDGLTFGPRAGTSRRACEQIFEARACAQMDWLAGKTGTPTFPNDDRSLDELKRLCAPDVRKTTREKIACGPLRPYKWYIAAYRTDRSDPRWTKVIGVLTERNWLADSGRVHGAGDQGPNPAAEIAMQIAARQAGLLPWSEP
jgi:hypothetical protein